MLRYLRYLNIHYPSNLRYLLNSQNSTSSATSFMPKMANKTSASFPNSHLSGVVGRYESYSSFVVNFWSPALTLTLILAAIIAVRILQLAAKKQNLIQLVLSKAKLVLEWNFLIQTFVSNFGQIIFYSSIEVRTNTFTEPLEFLSLLVCTVVNILMICVYVKMIRVVVNVHRLSSTVIILADQPQSEAETNHDLKQYKILYEGSRGDSLMTRMCFPVAITRSMLFFIVIAYLDTFPLVQMILTIVLNVAMIFYFLLVKPAKTRLEVAENVVLEMLLLVANICVLNLAMAEETASREYREKQGIIVVYVNTILMIGFSFYMLVKFLLQTLSTILAVIRKHQATRRMATLTQISRTPGIVTNHDIRNDNIDGEKCRKKANKKRGRKPDITEKLKERNKKDDNLKPIAVSDMSSLVDASHSYTYNHDQTAMYLSSLDGSLFGKRQLFKRDNTMRHIAAKRRFAICVETHSCADQTKKMINIPKIKN